MRIGERFTLLKLIAALLMLLVSSQYTNAAVRMPLVLLPKNATAGESLPVAVWLHGYGSNPSKLMSEPLYQDTADRLHIAIVGVYATNKLAEDSFEWTELPTIDASQVAESLAMAEKEKQVHFTTKMLFGFSQGACVAAELAARQPSDFCGAIILSPGSLLKEEPQPTGEANPKQIYYLSVGGEEAFGNIMFTQIYASYLGKKGAAVHVRQVPSMKAHNRPPDWADRFPEWVSAILSLKQ